MDQQPSKNEPIYLDTYRNLKAKDNYSFDQLVESLKPDSRQELVKDILAEKEQYIGVVFPNDRGMNGVDTAFNNLVGLEEKVICSYLKPQIEAIFKDAIQQIQEIENQTILSRIRILVLRTGKGLSVGLISERILFNEHIPEFTRMELADILAFLDPAGETFDWFESSIYERHPYLLPTGINFLKYNPIKGLEKIIAVKAKPKEEILKFLRKNPLKNCLAQLFIVQGLYKEYTSIIKPQIEEHWIKDYIEQVLTYPIFEKNKVSEKIKKLSKKNTPLFRSYLSNLIDKVSRLTYTQKQPIFDVAKIENTTSIEKNSISTSQASFENKHELLYSYEESNQQYLEKVPDNKDKWNGYFNDPTKAKKLEKELAEMSK